MSKKSIKYCYVWGNLGSVDELYLANSEKEAIKNAKQNINEDDDPVTIYKIELTPIKKLTYKITEEKLK